MKKREIFTIIVMAVFLCLLIAMIVQLFPLIEDISMHVDDEASIVEYVHSFGWRGVPALIGLAALEIIIPFIPAPAVGVLTGLSYGIYWGPLIFLSGLALGNLFVMISMRQLRGLMARNRKRDPESKKSHVKERLEKIKKPEIVAFFFSLIPFVSSTGPYLFAETRVSLGKYIIAVVAGNIPSAIMYMVVGDRISKGDHTTAIIMAAVVLVAAVFILVFRKKIMDKIMDTGN